MCEAKPGMRCDGSATKALAAAKERLADTVLNNRGDLGAVADAADRAQEAQWDADSTPKGRAALQSAMAAAEPGSKAFMQASARTTAAAVMTYQRTSQAQLMPTLPDGAPSALRAARAQVGQAREALAYANTHAHGVYRLDPDFQRCFNRQNSAQARVRALCAEWRMDYPEEGGGYPQHCADCGHFHSLDSDCPTTHPADSTSTDPTRQMQAAARDTTPERWAAVATSAVDADRHTARLAGDYMAAHGHLQCPTCGQWRSVRFDDHQCPQRQTQPIHPDYVYRGAPAAPTVPEDDTSHAPTSLAAAADRDPSPDEVRSADESYQWLVQQLQDRPVPDPDAAEVSAAFPFGPMLDNHNQTTGEIDTERVDADGRARPVLARNLKEERVQVADRVEAILKPSYGLPQGGYVAASSAVNLYEDLTGREWDPRIYGAQADLDRVYDAAEARNEAALTLAMHDLMNNQYANGRIGARSVDPDDHPALFGNGGRVEDEHGLYPKRMGSKYDQLGPQDGPKEIAARVRADLKEAQRIGWLPQSIKLSVTSDTRGGSAVHVRIGNLAPSWQQKDDPDDRYQYSDGYRQLHDRVEAIRMAYNTDSSNSQYDVFNTNYFGGTQLAY